MRENWTQGSDGEDDIHDPIFVESRVEIGAIGMEYQDGEVIIHQGELGNCMYVILEGQVELIVELGDNRVWLAIRSQGDFFGEMGIFEQEVRKATVRALGPVRVLAVDGRNFLRRIGEDPFLAFRLVKAMSARIRELSYEINQFKKVQNQLHPTGESLPGSGRVKPV